MGKTHGYWPTHPNKELQAVLVEFDIAGWHIDKGKGYYKVYCPCKLKHKTTVHLTPSDRYHGNHKLQYLRNQPCYNREKKG